MHGLADWCSSRASSTNPASGGTFSDSDKGGAEPPSRTAGPTNRMLSGGGLGTSIGKNPDGTYNQTLTRLHNSGRNPDRPMLAAFGKINELADHLGMTNVVKDGACDIFRMVVKPAAHAR